MRPSGAMEAGGLRVACLLLFALALPGCGGSEAPEGRHLSHPHTAQLHGETMGTAWNVKVRVPAAFDDAPLEAEIQAVLDRVDERMSTWKPDSELSRFNAAPAGAFEVSEETADVVAAALRVWARSEGAFDPTVMPLVDLWGFGPAGREVEPPDEVALAAALAHCGADKLRVEGSALHKELDALQVDLSAIAKGYGVDAVCARLGELGHEDFLVEVGGELRTGGNANGERPWRIGVDRPPPPGAGGLMSTPGTSLYATVEVGERAVATSGDYRNWREVEGVRLSHTVDPRTGRPVANRVASATVLAPNCMEADAYATALMVLGEEAALELVESLPGIEALLILREDGYFSSRRSSGFPAPLD